MSPVAFLAAHGMELLLGSTVILGSGCLLVLLSRAPVHRRRLGTLAIGATLAWLGLALVPLPRIGPEIEAGPAWVEGADAALPAGAAAFPPVHRMLELPEELGLPGRTEPLPGSEVVLQSTFPLQAGVAEGPASWFPALYLAGLALFAAWLLLGAFLLRRILASSEALPDSCRSILRELSGDARTQAFRVRMTRRRLRPFSCGVLHPTVILPARLCVPEKRDQLRQVLLHELAHVRAGDGWTQLLLALARPLLWVHPLFWWLSGRVRLAAEMLADDWAASRSDRRSYARELIGLAEEDAMRPAWPAIGMFRSRSEFYRRMEMLLDRRKLLSRSCSLRRSGAELMGAGLLVAIATGLWGARSASAQDVPAERTPELQVPIETVEVIVQEERVETRDLGRIQDRLTKVLRENQELRERIRSLSRSGELVRRDFWSALGVPSGYVRVRVKAGDTLKSLVEKHCGSAKQFLDQARIVNKHLDKGLDLTRLAAGQTILLPRVARSLADSPGIPDPLLQGETSGGRSVPPEAPSGGGGRAVRPAGRYILDLITRAIDLEGELELARHQLGRTKRLSDQSLASEEELLQAEVAHRTKTRKLELIRNLMKVEHEALQRQYEILHKQTRTSPRRRRYEAKAAIIRVEAQIKILRSAMSGHGTSEPSRKASK